VAGVRDYGNRMGIPTVNGTVFFDDRYIGNPLVFCGCVGHMPNWAVKGKVHAGDRIVALGGRTGRDGIHGATFSSAELTDTHADEFSHAVQIGNAITEKRTLDAILRARGNSPTECLYHGLTDCGAGGFSSAVGEMGGEIGAEVHLERAPLKYDGLRYDEIWISESQERMVLAVPPENMAALKKICDEEGVELADLGHFGTPSAELILNFKGAEVGRMPMKFLHDGIPMPTREATWTPSAPTKATSHAATDIKDTLLKLLAHPNIASKRWIVRQYDHEVQGNTIIKPLVGKGGIGPGDATVIKPVPGSHKGLAIACGLQVPVGDPQNGGDPYLMALAAVDECVRNLVCVGADPDQIAILDNFCWPSCGKPENLASLVRAAEGCYDAAKAYRTPFVSGKDSLNNQFRTDDGKLIEIPPTLLISGIGIVPDVSKCVTMDAKRAENHLALVHPRKGANVVAERAATARRVARLIAAGCCASVHDCSEGGIGVAVAEMLIAASKENLGAELNGEEVEWVHSSFFDESPGCYVVEVIDEAWDEVQRILDVSDYYEIGTLTDQPYLEFDDLWLSKRVRVPLSDLRRAFLGTLDW